MSAAEEPEEERHPLAGACVLVILGGVLVAIAFAIDEAVGVLFVVVVAVLALWRSARRRMPDSSATPPPEVGRPSCRECAGHDPVHITPSETQKGMLIYSFVLPERPNHTHVHLSPWEANAP